MKSPITPALSKRMAPNIVRFFETVDEKLKEAEAKRVGEKTEQEQRKAA